MNNNLRLTFELPRENWESVLRAVRTARTTTSDPEEQQQLDLAYQLIEKTLNEAGSLQLLDTPMEVHSTIPIRVKLLTGDWT